MPLEKQLVPVNFTGGLDTKTAYELVQPGSFLVLENCVRKKGALVQKRNGFAVLGKSILGSSLTIGAGTTLANFQSDLLLLNQSNVYSYAEASDKWISKGGITTALINQTAIVRNGYIQAMPDMAQISGYTVTVWEDSRGGVRYSVTDNSSNTTVVSDIELSATASRPKCITINDHVIVTYYLSSSIRVRRISITDVTSISGESVLISSVADQPYDITSAANGQAAVMAINTSANNIQVFYVTEAGIVGTPLAGYPLAFTLTDQAHDAISVTVDGSNGNIFITYADSANSDPVKVQARTATFTNPSTATVSSTNQARNITGSVRADNIYLYYETPVAGAVDSTVQAAIFSWDGVNALVPVTPDNPEVRSIGLASKAFQINDVIYYVGAYDTQLQPTYFLINEKTEIVARILGGLGNGLTAGTNGTLKSGLPRVSTVNATDVNYPLLIRTKVQAANDTTVLATNVGINLTSTSIGSTPFITDTLGDNMLIAGGTVLSYDGVSATEHGFHVFPENVQISLGAPGAGTFPALVSPPHRYTYAVTYEWVDAKGQVHKSAPSTFVSQDISATTDTIELVIPRLRLTAKKAPRASVKISIYRGQENLTNVLYLLRQISNDDVAESNVVKTPDIVTYTDTNADGVGLENREVLYTTGGVVENIAPPASKVLHKHKNRIFLAGLEDATKVVYSKEWQFQEGVAFSDVLPEIRTDALGGAVTALSTLDDKLVMFKGDRAYTLPGDGPVDTGANSDYPQPQLISGDVGTDQPASVVITPMGLMFKSRKGIYLLSRALEMVYIGAPVERYNSETITSATVIEDQNEVRFTTAAGPTLVYNYFFQQWSVFTNYESNSALFAMGAYLHLGSDGTVYKETPGLYEDAGSRIKMSMETSWFSFANMQGFQRIYWLGVLGDFLSHHYTQIQLAYDFEAAYSETVYFNTQTGLLQTTYGTGLYGEETPYGGAGSGVYQWRMKPRRQRCEAIKIRLEDIDTMGTNGGASFALVNMAFIVGLKTGINRQGPAKTI